MGGGGRAMDHPYFEWSPIVSRPRLDWPHGAALALCVVVSLEQYELDPPSDAYMPPDLPGGAQGRRPPPDYVTVSMREYGNRVGIFRVMDVLDRYGIRATAAIDAAVAGGYPGLVAECRSRGWEFAGHGQTVNRMITSRMSEEEETTYIRATLHDVETHTGSRPVGWLGPEFGESARTPAILATEGVTYVMDWPNDEQPYRMRVPSGDLISLPVMLELDDVFAHWQRKVPIWRWTRMVQEAFDTMHAEGAANGRLLVLSLHPWLIGHAYRISALDEALAHICRHPRVWKATGREVRDWYVLFESRGSRVR